jgi:type I restriction enzyme R subunit
MSKRFVGLGTSWPEKRRRAIDLRRNPTEAEELAWRFLRRNLIDGYYFRRQHVIDGFIVDFFCARLRLVIELDGAVHDTPEAIAYDTARDQHLASLGLTIARVPNKDVSRARLLAEVRKAVEERRKEPDE